MRRSTVRILLVEDDEDDHVLVREMLDDIDAVAHELHWVSTYDEGWDALQWDTFDVALVDFRIGERSGLELVRQAVDSGCPVPLIMLTGASDYEVDVASMLAGASDYLEKGELSPRLLERSIRYATRHAQDIAALKEARRLLTKAKDELEAKVQERTHALVAANQSLQREVAERQRAEEQLRHSVFHDSLTQLPNRQVFVDRVGHALRRAGRSLDRSFAIVVFNVDRFRFVNDSLGHLAGDEVLKILARRLKNAVRPGDTVARISGGDFAILVEDVELPESAVRCAERVRKQLDAPITIGDQEVFCTVSIGIAVSPQGYIGADSMIQDAIIAMHAAKQSGGDRFEVFNVSMRSDRSGLLKVESDLRRAIEKGGEFELRYQPIVALHGQRLFGFEALIRWNHPERGMLGPGEFIPLAEETGLILPIGRWVLEQATQQLSDWVLGFPAGSGLSISVNVSGRQLMDGAFIEDVRKVLDATPIEAARLRLEVTESFLMSDPEQAAAVLRDLKQLGVSLAIDDFGTGYSSLSYLRRFPFDVLKIDRVFVRAVAEREQDFEIVRAIIRLAGILEMDVVAEGAETLQELACLSELGCRLVQGFYFAPPLRCNDATALLAEGCNFPKPALPVPAGSEAPWGGQEPLSDGSNALALLPPRPDRSAV